MEKVKLTEARKAKGYSQNHMAEKLFMDVSNYHRREKGQIKISLSEWEKLSEILNTPIEDIFEPDESHIVIFGDNAVGNNNDTNTNTIYSLPEHFMDIQKKYIQKLEEENEQLKQRLEQLGGKV